MEPVCFADARTAMFCERRLLKGLLQALKSHSMVLKRPFKGILKAFQIL